MLIDIIACAHNIFHIFFFLHQIVRSCHTFFLSGTPNFISSKKFMKAEGGIERIVWMPKELKEFVAERLNKTAQELYGIENFTDMIGDETVATDPEALVEYLTEKGHPALAMDPMM